MKTLDVLVKAREVQAQGLASGEFGLRADGSRADPRDPDVVRRCARGSVCAAANCAPYTAEEYWLVECLAAVLPANFSPHWPAHNRVALFSNNNNLPTVLALFDRAIERQRTLESLLATESSEPSLAIDTAELRTADIELVT